MSHFDLLPRAAEYRAALDDPDRGITLPIASKDHVVEATTDLLRTWADYYNDRWTMYGDRDDKGVSEAFRLLADELDDC